MPKSMCFANPTVAFFWRNLSAEARYGGRRRRGSPSLKLRKTKGGIWSQVNFLTEISRDPSSQCSPCLKANSHIAAAFSSLTHAKQFACSASSLILFAAEGEGFEPSIPVKVYWFSKPARSTALPPFRI